MSDIIGLFYYRIYLLQNYFRHLITSHADNTIDGFLLVLIEQTLPYKLAALTRHEEFAEW